MADPSTDDELEREAEAAADGKGAPPREEPTLGDPDGDGHHEPYRVQPPG